MASAPAISIIICTRNRASALRETLVDLGRVRIPAGGGELIVVDNGSTDETAKVVEHADLPNLELRLVNEPRPGVSHARNTGLRNARGLFILFTDDDVSPADDWVEQLTTPLRADQYDAVAGRIILAPDLVRPWIRPQHASRMAAMDGLVDGKVEMFCANMAFRRTVLEKVPAFDPELGPGALGFGEDSLFSWQLAVAGCRLGFVEQAVAVHHPDPTRFCRAGWLDSAEKRGRTRAYILYHWEHEPMRWLRLRSIYLHAKLFFRRMVQPPGQAQTEGCPLWEMSYARGIAQRRQYLLERRRPRNYAQHGLVKLNGELEVDSPGGEGPREPGTAAARTSLPLDGVR